MDRNLPPLNSLRAFETAARMRTFTEAARALNVSQGAISRHIGQLEAFLGEKLFARAGQGPVLTEAGQDYARAIHVAFDGIEVATRRRLESRSRHSVRIRLFPTVAVKWLMGKLARFHTLNPDIDVQVTMTFKLVDMAAEDVDFAIQIPAEHKLGLRYEPLFPIALIPVGGPGSRPVVDPAAILCGSLLHSLKRPKDWPEWLAAAGVPSAPIRESLTFSNSSLAYQAAADGLGIAMGHTVLVDGDLASGRLVAMHPLVVRTSESYHLVSRNIDQRREVVAFRNWILG